MTKFVNIRKTLNRKKLDAQAKTIEKVNERIEKRLKVSILKLTELENDVLVNGIANNYFYDITGLPDVWSNCIVNTCKITTKTQVGGVVSSLVKKGLVKVSHKRTSESTVKLTLQGLKALETIQLNLKEAIL